MSAQNTIHCPACRQSFSPPANAEAPCRCPNCGSIVIGRCCDLEWIGGGAMGDVYRGRQADMGNRTVAIKVPKAGTHRIAERFEREINASARLKHENIVCAYDRGEQLGRPFLVMEFVAGRVLRDLVEAEHPLSPRQLARILLGVARGLAHAAQQGIINRDLKPDNIMLASSGDETAKILDYGLALMADVDGPAFEVTRSGALLGTPGYLAPEQAADPHNVTIAADVYALGCTGFYSLTKQPPFSASSLDEMRRCHAERERPPLAELRPDVPAELERLLTGMMAIEPAHRPSPAQIVTTLERLLPQLSEARPPAPETVGERIDLVCTGCGETYHVSAEAVGKRFQCRNKLCRQLLTIELPVAEAIAVDVDEPAAIGCGPPTSHLPGPPFVMSQAMGEHFECPKCGASYPRGWRQVGQAVVCSCGNKFLVPSPVVAVPPSARGAVPPTSVHGQPDASIPTLPLDSIVGEVMIAEAIVADEVVTLHAASAQVATPPETIPVLPSDAIVYSATSLRHAAAQAEMAPPVQASPNGFGTQPAVAYAEAAPQVAEAVAVEAPEASATGQPAAAPSAHRRPKRNSHLIEIGMVAAVLIGVAAVGWDYWRKYDPRGDRFPDAASWHPQSPWFVAQQLYKDKKWTLAKKAFLKFREDFPESPHAADVDFFAKMCDACEGIYSVTGDPDKGLAAMEAIFKEFRDSSSYKDYQFDLYQALQKLVERFLERAKKRVGVADIEKARKALADIEKARRAIGLLKTVAESLADPAIAENTQELETQIAQTERHLNVELARKEIYRLLQIILAGKAPDEDEAYRQVDQLLAAYPELNDDKKIKELRLAAEQSEAKRVSYAANEDAQPATAIPDLDDGSQTTVVVWDAPLDRPAADTDSSKQVLALAGGVLYVFDRDGRLLWSRRLGIDSERLPSPVAATSASPDTFVASSSEDGALLSLRAATGEVLWRLPTPGVVTAPLTIVSTPGNAVEPAKQRGFLPTSRGAIHVFELVLGKRMGTYHVHKPLTVGGTYDPTTRLVFFPADEKRVFVIDPAKIDHPDKPEVAACRSVLLTDHASGAVRSEALVVDRYFVLIAASDIEQMRLKTFDIVGEALSKPRAKPLAELSLAGWSWFPPQIEPDRALIVTDRGELGLFGFNLDNPQDEAIYPQVVDKDPKPSTRLQVRGDFRAAAVHLEEHLLWVLVDGKLQKLHIDVLGQKLRPVWKSKDMPVLGVPVHEPQSSGWHDDLMLYLTTKSYDGQQLYASAVAGESGKIVWRRQLGVNPLVDPLTVDGQTLIVDRSGRVLRLPPPDAGSSPAGYRQLEPPDRAGLDDMSGKEISLLYDGKQSPYLLATLDGGARLSLRDLAADEWRTVRLPAPVHGLPCFLGDVLVVPCADGSLHRFSKSGEHLLAINEVHHQWATHRGPQTAGLLALGENGILLIDGGGVVQRLRFDEAGVVPQWEVVGDAFRLPGELAAPPLLYDGMVLFVERSGAVHAVDAENPGRPIRNWNLNGRPSGTAVLRGGRLLVALDRKKLACINPANAEKDAGLAWSVELEARLCGAPVLADEVLMVTAQNGNVCGLRLADGKRLWSQTLTAQAGPAAAAVPFGKQRMLVPLRDGSLLTLPIPEPVQELAEMVR